MLVSTVQRKNLYTTRVPFKTKEDIDNTFRKFTDFFKVAAHHAVPIEKAHTTLAASSSKLIDNLLRRRACDWQTILSPNLKKRLKAVKKKLHRALQHEKFRGLKRYPDKILLNSISSYYSLCKATKHLKRLIRRESPIRLSDSTRTRSDKEKWTVFAERTASELQPIFQPKPQ